MIGVSQSQIHVYSQKSIFRRTMRKYGQNFAWEACLISKFYDSTFEVQLSVLFGQFYTYLAKV